MFETQSSPAPNTPSSNNSPLKSPLLYGGIAILIAFCISGWILFNRYQDNKDIERRNAEARAEKQHEQDRAAIEQLGGKDFDIQMFFANPTTVKRGDTSQLCYGVANAKSVTLVPQDNPVWPSPNRCVSVAPKKTTTYTLTATSASGETKTQSLDIKVR